MDSPSEVFFSIALTVMQELETPFEAFDRV